MQPKMLEAMKLLHGGMRMMKLSSKGWHVRMIKLSDDDSFLEWGAGSWRKRSKSLRLSDVAEVAIDRPGFSLPSDWTFFFLGIDDGGGGGIERWVPLGCKRPQEARMWIVALSQVLTPAAALFAQQIVGAASAAPPRDSSGRDDDDDDDVDNSEDGGGDGKQDRAPGELRRERRRGSWAARSVTEDRSGGVGGGFGGVDNYGMEAAAALPAFDPLRRLESGAQRALSVRRRRTGSVDFSRLSARSAGRRGSCHAQQQMPQRPHGMRRVFSALDVRTACTNTARYAQLENRDQIVGVGLGLLNEALGTRLSSTRGKALSRSGSPTVPLATSVASSSTESGGPWKFGRRPAEGVAAGSTSVSSAPPEGKERKEGEDGGPEPLRTSDEIVRQSLEGEGGDNDEGDDGETIGNDDGKFGSHRRSTSLPAGLMNPIYKKDRSLHFASIPHIVSILTDEFESNERLREMLLLTRPAFAPTSLELLRPFVAQFRNVRAASSRASNGTPLSRRIHGHMSRKLHPRNESERTERSLVRTSLSCLNGGMGSSRGSNRRSFGSVVAHPQPTESEPAGRGDRSNAPPSASMRQLRVLSLLNLWLKRDYAATDLVHDVEANAFLRTFLIDLSDSLVPGVGKTAVNLLTRLRALEVEVAERERVEEANQRGSSSSHRRDKSADAFLRIHASSLDIASSRERQGTLEREGTARILTTVLPKKFISHDLQSFSACDLAQQLSLIDFAYLYKHIDPRALINKTWSKQGKHGSDWAAGKVVDLFNQRVRWIGTEMTKPGSHISWPTRVKMLQLFIDIGRESLRLNNFHLLFQIIGGIEQQFITQLKSLWSALPDPYHETYSELKDVVDPKGNYRVYREHLAAVATERHIPYLGVVLKDVTMIHDGLPTHHADADGRWGCAAVLAGGGGEGGGEQRSLVEDLRLEITFSPIPSPSLCPPTLYQFPCTA